MVSSSFLLGKLWTCNFVHFLEVLNCGDNDVDIVELLHANDGDLLVLSHA